MKNSMLSKKIKEAINKHLMDAEGVHGGDLHSYLFNECPPYTNVSDARKAVNQLDVFKAIDAVTKYEMDNFGQTYTKITPTDISNMLFYIAGGELLYESETLQEKLNVKLTGSDLRQIRKELRAYIKRAELTDDLVEYLLF